MKAGRFHSLLCLKSDSLAQSEKAKNRPERPNRCTAKGAAEMELMRRKEREEENEERRKKDQENHAS